MSRKSKRNRGPDAPVASAGGGGHASGAARGRRTTWIAAAVAAVVALAFVLLYAGSRHDAPATDAGAARTAALASLHAPTEGAPEAKVHVVEFLDPACETCALFYPIAKEYVAANPGKVRLSLRHVAFHPGSEYAVRLLEASRKQGRYWVTLERLLGTQSSWSPNHVVQPELVDRAVAGLGLDMARLAADMQSPEATANLQQDLRDAATLQVTQTPEYFVNGRGMPSFGEEQLRTLIRKGLASAYP